ncbi:MAG: N-acetylmuramic acid 6-phosphate etherase [Sulfobacillus acidophilus]|uniref:N-acetylmuramic acid 6-phosphate etherase n=1 Tax=Sulfobacillus acidophilus TaxID=53633 RepID=A0A2T2WJX1_9FIRM|nr:MAG: N-acetylmuramic acid 6-phosphate etherase [Sulfobacillus acidophilus]
MNLEWTALSTELWNADAPDLSTLDALEVVTLMNAADQTVALAVKQELPHIAQAIESLVKQLSHGGRLFYIGAGTSGRLGILDAAECPPTFNTNPELVQAIIAGGPSAVFEAQEGAEDDLLQGGHDLLEAGAKSGDVVVGITASGLTPYVIGALDWARHHGLATISISCNQAAAVAHVSDIAITVNTGPEVVMGSTRLKAGTAQKMILNMLSTGAMVGLGKTYRNLMVDMRPTNRKLHDRALRIVMLATETSQEKAQRLLEQAGGEPKVAIAMALLNTDADQARHQLNRVNGVLGRLSAHS